MSSQLLDNPAERRKLVRLKVRPDLQHIEQKYEGKTFFVIKDPVCLRYYRFNKQEYFVFSLFDGEHTMEDARQKFEDEFKPHRLEFSDLEAFARQLVTAGLVQHEQAGTGKHLFQRRAKQRRTQRLAKLTNILYVKIPVFDPDRLLTWMYQYLWWIFTPAFFAGSVLLMLAAVLQVTLHFQAFYDKMPEYEEFFAYQTVLYMWISLGFVKIIHEFGHGLSCKAFKGECHEMGFLLMCLSPALYANVTDAWTVADKWKRIIISFAGIYVELVIAALATFVWWYTPHLPFVNNIAMSLMVLCSVSTIVFNANPLMRFDGYYMMADWLEIPNLRDRSNKFLNNLFLNRCLGIEVPPEQYMAPGRKVLFFIYAVASYVYRWVVTFSIIWFLSDFLNPKLQILSRMLAVMALGSMFIWPGYRMIKNLRQRGRVPDMKPKRVMITLGVAAAMLVAFFVLPLPVSRVRETGLVAVNPDHATPMGLSEPAVLAGVLVREGQPVRKGDVLARFVSTDLEQKLFELRENLTAEQVRSRMLRELSRQLESNDPSNRLELEFKDAELKADRYRREEMLLLDRVQRLSDLRATMDGYVMGVPKSTEIGRQYNINFVEATPIITVADPSKLVVKLPVSALDYQLLKEDLRAESELTVSVHVQGREDRVYPGKIVRLPESNEDQLPVQLTQRGGGPIAVRPAGDPANPNRVLPVAPIYLVTVEMMESDASVRPGAMVMVKVHCRWRSGSWWVWRKLNEALDLGLYQ